MALTPMGSDYPAITQSQPTFNDNVATLMNWWPGFVTELNATILQMAGYAADAVAAGTTSAVWVSGTSYTIGQVRYSPINFGNYRRKTNGAGTTDPSLDTTNWASTLSLTSPVFLGTVTAESGLTLTALGARIKGDFNNSTHANRPLIQNSTANASTTLGVIPNGTGQFCGQNIYASSDPDNSGFAQFRCGSDTAEVLIGANRLGTGTYYPIGIYTGGIRRVAIDTAGAVSILQTLAVTGVLTATAGLAVGSFTIATRPAHANGLIIRVSNGAGGANCQMSHSGSWVNLG